MKSLLLILSFTFSGLVAAEIKVNGAGASFPFPIYSYWFETYEKENNGVKFNYQAIGSGGGIRQFVKETVDFGATDAPMGKDEMKKVNYKIKHIPTVLGAVAVAYNLPEVKSDLKLDGPTLGKIFMAKITKWNHKDIKALNPKVNLPAKDIMVVRRADGSGTTKIFADFIAKTSPEWKNSMGVGKSLRWPGATIGAKGNDGITGVLKKSEGTIGYVELAYAIKNGLPTVAVKNKSGKFMKPSISGVSASATSIKKLDQVTDSITNAEGADVYPISSFTYILLGDKKKRDEKQSAVRKFLEWALTDGQKYAETLHYAPLPKELAQKIIKDIK